MMKDIEGSQQMHITTLDGGRQFACSPIAVLAIIVNDREQILLMAHPEKPSGWQVVNGAVEAEETPLDAGLREIYEEAGRGIRVRPIGTVHVSAFHYDERVRYMISVSYLFAYEGGKIHPGDDMEGSEHRWWSLSEMESEEFELLVPPGEKWILARAVDLYRLWVGEDSAQLPGFNLSVRGKTK